MKKDDSLSSKVLSGKAKNGCGKNEINEEKFKRLSTGNTRAEKNSVTKVARSHYSKNVKDIDKSLGGSALSQTCQSPHARPRNGRPPSTEPIKERYKK